MPFDQLQSGARALPAEGARVDVAFEGTARGPKLSGTVRGVDYLYIRADGCAQLHIHATITTEGGQKIAFTGGGVATLEPGVSVHQLRENITLFTSAAEYAWVNRLPIWAVGTVDLAKGEIRGTGYIV